MVGDWYIFLAIILFIILLYAGFKLMNLSLKKSKGLFIGLILLILLGIWCIIPSFPKCILKFHFDKELLAEAVVTENYSKLRGYTKIDEIDGDGVDFHLFSTGFVPKGNEYGILFAENDFFETPYSFNWHLLSQEQQDSFEKLSFNKIGNKYIARFGNNGQNTYVLKEMDEHWYIYCIQWR